MVDWTFVVQGLPVADIMNATNKNTLMTLLYHHFYFYCSFLLLVCYEYCIKPYKARNSGKS
jgi:hypothetical protein